MKRLNSIIVCLMLAVSTLAQDYSAQVRSDILPWVESVGQRFGLTEDALGYMEWSNDLLTACSQEQYERLLAWVKNPVCYNCPTGYYRLSNDRGTLYLTDDNPKASTSASYTTALSSVVRLERCSDGGFYVKMQGRYLGSPTKNRSVPVTSEPTKFYPVVKTPGGKVALTTRRGDYSALHCGWSDVIGYTLDDEASYWNISDATDFEITASVTADEKYYHTLFAPFSVQTSEGVQAFTLAEHEDKAVATGELQTVPAETAVLLRSDEKKMNFSIADDDHDNVQGNIQLRNTAADEMYADFNRAFLIQSGEKNNYTFYREYYNTSDKLYFWQQALVIQMVEDRFDFRGDPGTASLIVDLLDAFMAQEGTVNAQGISDWSWNEYNDDLLWAGLAFIRGYRITGQERFLNQAVWAWNYLYNRGWDDVLEGGIWWSVKKEEKSGLSNNPAVCMASYLYDATGDQQYLDKAIAIHEWVCKKLRKSDGSIDEKIKADGKLSKSYNVYNMGTFVEGCAALYRLTSESKYRSYARKTIEYVMVNRTDGNGIVSHSSKYDGTYQSEFARGMAFWLQAYPQDWKYNGFYTTNRSRITYFNWMRKNADAAYKTRNNETGLSNCEWNKTTPLEPAGGQTGWEGKGWECDACVSSVVMAQVTPEVQPGTSGEKYVDIDDHSADFAYHPEEVKAMSQVELDEKGIMTAASVGAQADNETATATLLTGTLKNVKVADGSAKLKKGSDGLGFFSVSASTVQNANTAFLAEKRTLLIDLSTLDNPLTAISPIMENDELQLKNDEDGAVYDIVGRRIVNRQSSNRPLPSGLYIKGNKIILKN